MMDFSNLSDSELLEFKSKLEAQAKRHDLLQNAQKIILNTLYGCMGNQHFVFFETAMAEAITLSGQYGIKLVAIRANEFLQKISGQHDFDFCVAGDTDSVLFCLTPIYDKFPDRLTEDEKTVRMQKFADGPLQKVIDDALIEACDTMQAFDPSALVMERESICDAALFVAKKKYAMSIYDQEGVIQHPPKLKVKGLDSKRAVFSKTVRDKLNEAYKTLLYESDEAIIDFVEQFKKEFMAMSVDDMAFITSANNLDKYDGQAKGVPAHIKATLAHNRFIQDKGLEEIIPPIISGAKVKVVDLKSPNPVHAPRFAFQDTWRSEFGLDEYINKEEQFKRSFISPLENVTENLGIKIDRTFDTYELF